MNYKDEINELHKKGFVILRATLNPNRPIGWRQPNSKNWGYTKEMEDPQLTVYRREFNAVILAKSHCGFYMGHGGLCCIDLDTKHSTIEETTALKNAIIKQLKSKVAVETTKSNGYHIYFRYAKRLDNIPDWTGKEKNNWVEVYYSKRFVACYLSNSKRYTLEHGAIDKLKPLSNKEHTALLQLLPQRKKIVVPKKRKVSALEVDKETWEEAENFVSQLEEKQLDITGNNSTWFKIGKSFAASFGIKGFDMFNRISRFSEKYNPDTIEAEYQRYVEDDNKPRDRKITIGTFFKLCLDNGLNNLKTLRVLKTQPEIPKEFKIEISKENKSVADRCHIVISAFLLEVKICCIDNAAFFVFRETHWIKCTSRDVLELISDFINRSTINPRYIEKFRTVPYLEMMLKELRIVTQRESIEPYTGNLAEGIFINMRNGILHVNLQTGRRKLLDWNADYNFTTVLPFDYDPTVTCPKFDSWINAQLPNKDTHIAYYAFVASCLTRHKADIIMLLAGETMTGKSSLIDITRRLIGIENSVAISSGTLFGGGNSAPAVAMQMENKLLAYDFDAQPFKQLENLLKVAAQEPLEGWQMHVARRPVINYGRLIVAMNPHNYSVFNAAVARRFITINMDVKVVKDNSVMPSIYNHELAGIFNHVLNIGIKHLKENGGQIKQTDSMRQATIDLHMGPKDAVRWFDLHYTVLKQSTDLSNKKTAEQKIQDANPECTIIFVTLSEMYQKFRIWMEDVEGYTESRITLRKHFAADLENYGIKELVYKIGKNEPKRGAFVGVKKL